MENKKVAAFVLIYQDDRVLTVSRKGDKGILGFPGGKPEPGETLEEAARRELLQETGLIAEDLEFLMDGEDGHGYFVTIFRADSWHGIIQTDEEGVVAWSHPADLLVGPFAFINKQAILKAEIPVWDPDDKFALMAASSREIPMHEVTRAMRLSEKAVYFRDQYRHQATDVRLFDEYPWKVIWFNGSWRCPVCNIVFPFASPMGHERDGCLIHKIMNS